MTVLLEYVRQTGPFEVDAENAVIKGVKVLGLESANGRTYTREGVAKALGMYEGLATNLNHPSKAGEATTVERRNGWLANVRQDADGGLRADWHLLKSDPQTPKILEAATRRPQLLGLSHNASGQTKRINGREVVESIDAVHSVDLVADPATVKGLNESRGNTPMKLTVKALIERLKTRRPGYSRGLQEAADSGVLSPDAAMDAPKGEDDAMPPTMDEPEAETADHEQALKDGFRGAIMAILDDDSMDLGAKVSRIKEILTMQDKLANGGKGGKGAKGGKGGKGDDEPDKDDKDAGGKGCDDDMKKESRLRLEIAGLRALLEANVKPDKVLTKALSACTTEAEIKELVESAKSSGRAQPSMGGAKSAGRTAPLKEEKTAAIPEGREALVNWLKKN